MARRLRIQFEGAIYHVTLRGIERRPIFTEDCECERFLERVGDGVENHDVRVYMFCLMTNHAHLALETPRANLDRFMHDLTTAYTVYFNLRHSRSGHLTQGRYGAVLVEGDEYLLNLTRYLHLNPVFTTRMKDRPMQERIEALRRYPWSSYPSYVGKEKPLGFVDYAPILAMMNRRKAKQRSAYGKFVETGIARSDEEFAELLHSSKLSVGSDAFNGRMRDMYLDLVAKGNRPEDALFRRIGARLSAGRIVDVVCEELGVDVLELRRQRKTGWVRPVGAKMLCKYAGLTQREVADMLGLRSGAAVSTQIKRFREALPGDAAAGKIVARIERRLSGEGQ